jgi:hypothetical protein
VRTLALELKPYSTKCHLAPVRQQKKLKLENKNKIREIDKCGPFGDEKKLQSVIIKTDVNQQLISIFEINYWYARANF